MNRIPTLQIGCQNPGRRMISAILAACLAVAVPCFATTATAGAGLRYDVLYTVTPDPGTATVQVSMKLSQQRFLLRELRMTIDARLSDLSGNGTLVVDEDVATWTPPAGGGVLSWRVSVPHLRNGSGHDAWLQRNWGIFRAEDIIPRAATRTLVGAASRTSLHFRLPPRWSVVTQYFGSDDRFEIVTTERRFDQPSGWIIVGRIGVRRETISGIRVAVAAPLGQSVRRMDTLALLNWTLPELARLLPELPQRLTVISAGDPMWRGGLSAPDSLFIHADRPLVSENATSTLLHEVMHLALGLRSRRNYDWIVEGLAEHYSLELLRRSGTISDSRYSAALADQADWARQAETLCQPVSSGPATALAVTIFADLDKEIKKATDGGHSLDDLVRRLFAKREAVGITELVDAATGLTGAKPDSLHSRRLPGCGNIQARS
jgi:hypothetical protein